MEKRNYGLIVLGVASLLFFASTVFSFLAYVGAENDAARWENKAQTRKEKIGKLKQKVETLKSNITQLQSKISEQKFTISNLEGKVKQPMLFSSSPDWYEQRDGDLYISFAVYNFGKTSAQNVNAKMYIYDSSDSKQPKATIPLTVGNIAGETYKKPSYEFSIDTEINSGDTAIVKVSSCKDCLMLWNRIPSLQDTITLGSGSSSSTKT